MRKRLALTALTGLLLIAVWTAAVLSVFLSVPYRGFEDPVLLDYAAGTSTMDLAAELERRGVVRSRWLFLALRALKPRQALLAGEYRFEKELSARDVFDRIALGKIYQVPMTIPEGLTRFEVAGLVEDYGFDCAEEFLEVSGDAELVRDLAPQAASLEGFLFPDTYLLPRKTHARQIAELMVRRFRQVYERASAGSNAGLDLYRALTLASMIEKETGRGAERGLVSSVFHNRLKRGMRLQCDPTIVYGLILEQRYRGKIYRSDLTDPHPYNTYVHYGLPPGPIANPGEAALRAALHPPASDYLYFVAETVGAGKHVFSTTPEAHNRAVSAYRRTERSR